MELGFELQKLLQEKTNNNKLSEPVKVKCLCRFVDLKNGVDEDRWFDYSITSIHSNCFLSQDGRSRPWWAVKKFKIVGTT